MCSKQSAINELPNGMRKRQVAENQPSKQNKNFEREKPL